MRKDFLSLTPVRGGEDEILYIDAHHVVTMNQKPGPHEVKERVTDLGLTNGEHFFVQESIEEIVNLMRGMCA